jgi:hypothetical protein
LITEVQSNTGRQSVGSSSVGDSSAAVRPVVSFSIKGSNDATSLSKWLFS